jgi:plasmid stabilization system protein ParE
VADQFRLLVLPRAEEDVAVIYSWLHDRSPSGAARWLQAFEVATSRITQAPLEFALAPEATILGQPVRQVLFKTPKGRTYRAVFLISNDVISVLRVRGPGQPTLRSEEL